MEQPEDLRHETGLLPADTLRPPRLREIGARKASGHQIDLRQRTQISDVTHELHLGDTLGEDRRGWLPVLAEQFGVTARTRKPPLDASDPREQSGDREAAPRAHELQITPVELAVEVFSTERPG